MKKEKKLEPVIAVNKKPNNELDENKSCKPGGVFSDYEVTQNDTSFEDYVNGCCDELY